MRMKAGTYQTDSLPRFVILGEVKSLSDAAKPGGKVFANRSASVKCDRAEKIVLKLATYPAECDPATPDLESPSYP
jgi:hypothetical protein